jgi:hypothetical protein
LAVVEGLFRRQLTAAALVGLTVGLPVVVGWPDIGRSLDLVTGQGATSASEFAFVALLCWLALAVLSCIAAIGVIRDAGSQVNAVMRRRLWCTAVCAAGLALLLAGIARHQHEYRVCCANAITSQQAEHLVP